MSANLPYSKQDYEAMLVSFEKLVLIAITFSDLSGKVKTTNRGIESTKIYTRITLSAMTIQAILPGNYINRAELWDFPSIATLARTLIEVCHRYLYLSQSGLDDAEAKFRLALYFYHLNNEKYKLLKNIATAEVLKEFEINLPIKKAELSASPVYQKLTKERAKDVCSGRVCMHLSDDEVASQFSLISGKFKGMYRLLSNHAHGSPFAVSAQSDERGRGIENDVEVAYVSLVLQLLRQYLSKVILVQATMFSLKDKAADDYQYCVEAFENALK